ncbi:MAG TPA: hypothetical protein VH415_14945 [Nitrososphaeraceae archaeon]
MILISSSLSMSGYLVEAQSTTNMSNNTLPGSSNSTKVSGLYQDNKIGFQIQLPPGWTGAELYKFYQNGSSEPKIKVSPLGIDPLTGQVREGDPLNLDSVAITISTQNASNLLPPWKALKDQIPNSVFSSQTPYLDLMKWAAEKGFGCKVLSQNYTKINEVNSLREAMECQGDRKNVSYSFANDNYILGIVFDGPAPAVDRNMQKFVDSINTLKIDKPTDIQSLIAGFDSEIKGWQATTPL